MPRHRRTPTWAVVSKAAGLTIIFTILVSFIWANIHDKSIDAPVSLAFLSLAGFLIGAHEGWQIVRRNGNSKRRNGNGDANGQESR